MKKKNMKIFIIGGGEIGGYLTSQLVKEGYDLTVIDRNKTIVGNLANSMDIICYEGNGASPTPLRELGAGKADILIAVTNSDEANILSCTTAHLLGTKHTIARIRDIDYASQNSFYKENLGISMIFNPDLATAMEIVRLLRFPSATRVEVFAKGRAELVQINVRDDSPLIDKSLMEINQSMGINLLVCAICRNEEAFVPNGDTVIGKGDVLYMTGAADEFRKSFKKLHLPVKPMRSVMLAGGTRISHYLAKYLLHQGVSVTLVERNRSIAVEFSENIDGIHVINEDILSYLDSMSQVEIANTDAFISLTDSDEYNILFSMYAETKGIGMIISRVNMKSRLKVLPPESKICTISRAEVAADRILGYSRSLLNAEDKDAVESLYRLMDGKIEFIEFKISPSDSHLNTPLKNLKMKHNILIGSIIRGYSTIIPRGDDMLLPEDTVLVASINTQIAKLEDIFA